jgi:hypothetical protein
LVLAILDRAKQHGEITHSDLESIVEGGLEAKDHICPDDVGDTLDAL